MPDKPFAAICACSARLLCANRVFIKTVRGDRSLLETDSYGKRSTSELACYPGVILGVRKNNNNSLDVVAMFAALEKMSDDR